MGAAPTQLVDFDQALRLVLTQAAAAVASRPPKTEFIPLLDSLNRVLAQPLRADRDQPAFNRSTRDGFALQSEDASPYATLKQATLKHATLKILGQLRAGEIWQGAPVTPGTAIEIMTGAPVPAGANAVVMVEHTHRTGDTLTLTRPLSLGDNIVPRAAEARLGDILLPAGTRIGAAEIALAATCGQPTLQVFARPLVAIVSTGDELVEIDQAPEPHQIRNSNSYAIAAMVTAAGGQPHRLAVARDRRQDLWERVAQGRIFDLLLFSGGVSMGQYDLVEDVLAEFHAEFVFTGVAMQPGKPVVFGRLPPLTTANGAGPECFFFGLPGNPISTQVTFHCFAELFLRTLSGEPTPAPRWAQATVAEPIPARPSLTRLLPAHLAGTHVTLTPWQGSGDLAANARANCYAELLPNRASAPGDVIRILLR